MPLFENSSPAERFLAAFEQWRLASPVFAKQHTYIADTYIDMEEVNPKTVELTGIAINPQGQGTGTAIMKEVFGLADRFGVSITLEAFAGEGEWDEEAQEMIPSEEQQRLEGWYERLGFYHTGWDGPNNGPIFIRTPKTLTEAEYNIAKPVHESLLIEADVNRPAFKQWFAGSKVTRNRRPLMVTHGTAAIQ